MLSATGNAAPSVLAHSNDYWASSAIPTLVPGATVSKWTDSQFNSASVSDFAQFDFIYLGDSASSQSGVVSAKNTWGAAITGRAVITGVHFEHAPSHLGASAVFTDMANWIHAGTGTGLLVSTQFQSTGPDWIPSIAPFNGITYAATGGGFDVVEVTDPGHATMQNSTDTSLSNFGNSSHSIFDQIGSFTSVAEVCDRSGYLSSGGSTPAAQCAARGGTMRPHVLVTSVTVADQDGDGIPDSADNCPTVANAGQVDINGNGVGDTCEAAPMVTISPKTSTVPTGTSITFTASASDADDPLSSLTYEWRVDGIVQAGATSDSFTTLLTADATVRVTVRDPGNLSGFDESEVTVITNRPPAADAGAPYTVAEGDSLTLSALGSSDPDGDTLSYAWDLDNDGSFDDETLASPTLTWAQLSAYGVGDDGVYTVGVRVDDGHGEHDIATTTITVNNAAPAVDDLAVTSPIDENELAMLSGTITDPGMLDTFTLDIDWGDGSAVQMITLGTSPISSGGVAWDPLTREFSVSRQYLDDGLTPDPSDVYSLTVSLADDDGGEAGTAGEGGNIYLTGHDVLLHDGQNGYDSVILDFLRGAGTSAEIAMANYSIAVIGSGVGSWGWTDVPGFGDRGAKPGYASTTYYDTDDLAASPSLWDDALSKDGLVILSHTHCGGCDLSTAGSSEINANASAIADAINNGMDLWANSGADLSTYYDFLPPGAVASGVPIGGSSGFAATGDGVAIGIQNQMINGHPTHNRFATFDPVFTVYETRGSEIISLGVQSAVISGGGIGTGLAVTVNNVPPEASVAGPATVSEGTPVTFTGSFIDQGTDDSHAQAWSVLTSNGQVVTPLIIPDAGVDSDGSGGSSFSFTPSENGTYTISYTVTDDDGGTDTEEFVLTVNNVAPTVAVGPLDPIEEGDVPTLMATFSDPGVTDSHDVIVDWADPNDATNSSFSLPSMSSLSVGNTFNSVDGAVLEITALDLDAGKVSFSVQGHQYLDDGIAPGNNTDQDTSNIIVTVSDDDSVSSLSGSVAIQSSGLSVTQTDDATALANTILGAGIAISSATYSGAGIAAGTFSGGLSAGIGIDEGIILTSGDVNLAPGPNSADASTGANGTPGDSDLDALIPGFTTHDATILEIELESTGGDVFFNYVFASEEYNEFTNSSFNDVFGFFLDGVNIALIPGTSTPVSINNVNGGNPLGVNASNAGFYNNNDLDDGGPYFNVEYDGFTSVFTAQFLGLAPGAHTLKLAIADAGDFALDSAVFIQAGSLSDIPTPPTPSGLVVQNVAPSVALDPLAPVDEGGFATLSGSYSDPGLLDEHEMVVDWDDPNSSDSSTFLLSAINSLAAGDTFSSTTDDAVLTVTSISGDTVSFSVQHQYLNDGAAPGNGTVADVSNISVTIRDDDLGANDATDAVLVQNLPPVISDLVSSSPACGGAMENREVTISGSFDDEGILDSHTVLVDWGDGNSGLATISGSGGSWTFDAIHTYADGGIYSVTVTVADDDTGSVAQDTLMVITGVGVNGNTLYVVGTDLADQVTINQQGNGLLKVHANFLPNGNFKTFDSSGIELINTILCGGDDHATIAAHVDIPAIMDGGEGNDHLNGGGGSNVLLGGEGDDRLVGGSVQDVLIGGMGSDRLVANGGQDILVGDATIYDLNYMADPLGNNEALLKIMDEWNSDDDLETRRDHISGTPGGLNDAFFLKLGAGATLVEDDAEDVLTGSAGEDWFLLLADDVATDLKAHRGDLETSLTP